jgi:single-stranded DNA-binding protein
MSSIKATFSGSIVADPEMKTVGQSNVLEFPVYVNHTRKNKDTGEYEKTGEVSKIRVNLWREKADMADVQKGDIVEVVGSLIEKTFNRKDGSEGRQLQTDFVESVTVKFRKDGVTPKASGQLSRSEWDNFVNQAPDIKNVSDEAPF